MADLGRKYTCYSCHTKFYDLNKPVPTCPKCGADQRDAEEAPAYTPARGRAARVVEEPPEEEDLTPAAEPVEGAEDEDEVIPVRDEEPEEEEEEEEY